MGLPSTARPSVEPAGPRASWIAAGAAGTHRACKRTGLGPAHGDDGEDALGIRRQAGGTGGRSVAGEDQLLEGVRALAADVLVGGHGTTSALVVQASPPGIKGESSELAPPPPARSPRR